MNENKHVLNESSFSEKSFSVKLGRLFFKSRNFVSAPLFLLMFGLFIWEYENEVVLWSVGPAIICLGEALRLWAMRHIGRSARTRKDKARRLVTTGPYAYTRNPLYLGNHIVLVGFCLLSELIWFVPITLGLCFVFYSLIIVYEEDLLKQRFGEDYLRYAAETPRWISIPHLDKLLQPEWREAFWRERSTIYGIIIGMGFFGLKELLSDILLKI